MKENQEETQLKLSKKQIQNVINSELNQEHGLNDLFSMMVNGLMLSGRNHFLETKDDPQNKGNGYGKATRRGIRTQA